MLARQWASGFALVRSAVLTHLELKPLACRDSMPPPQALAQDAPKILPISHFVPSLKLGGSNEELVRRAQGRRRSPPPCISAADAQGSSVP
jgi:hypothetical protein